MNAMIIEAKDNVAVAVEQIAKGEAVTYLNQGETITLTAVEDIIIYHKLATRDIQEGEPVVKYGENIGVATAFIPKGAHVHVHNVESMQEDRSAKE